MAEYHVRFTWGQGEQLLLEGTGKSRLGGIRNATGKLRQQFKRYVYESVSSIDVQPCDCDSR